MATRPLRNIDEVTGLVKQAVYDPLLLTWVAMEQPVLDGGTIDVGDVTIAGTVAVSGPLTNAELRATAVPISLATAPSTPVTNANLDSPLSGILTELQSKTEPADTQQVAGTVTANAGTNLNTSALSTSAKQDTLLAELQLKADLTETQPVSVASLPLPSSAATAAKQDTGNASLSSIDGKLGTLGQKTMAGSVPVVLASDQASVPVAATLQAGSASIGKLGANSGVDIGDIDITSIAAGDNNIGNVDIVTMPNVTLAAGTNTNEVVGDVAHDSPAAGNPVLIGGYASAAAPSDVSGDADVVRAWMLRNGSRCVTLTAAGALIAGDAANGLDVDVTRLPALVAGSAAIGKLAANSGVDIGDVDVTSIAAGDNNIGNVDIVTVPTDPFGANADAASATGSISAKLRFIAATGIPVTSVPSHAVTNAGTFATQVDGAALTALQLIDDVVYTDDTSTHSTGSSKGALFMAAATPTDAAVNANDIGAVAMTTDRKLHVSVQDSLPAGSAAIGKLSANSGVDIGDVDVTSITPPTLTKGTQGATGFSTQNLKDAGRVSLRFYATAVAAGATTVETAITLTKSSDVAATSAAASFVVTSGKRFRITAISVTTRGHNTATAQVTTFNFRVNTAGAVTTSSTPIILAVRSATPATANSWDRVMLGIPDGLELLGDGTMQFGITAAATFTTNAPTWDVTIIGFEY